MSRLLDWFLGSRFLLVDNDAVGLKQLRTPLCLPGEESFCILLGDQHRNSIRRKNTGSILGAHPDNLHDAVEGKLLHSTVVPRLVNSALKKVRSLGGEELVGQLTRNVDLAPCVGLDVGNSEIQKQDVLDVTRVELLLDLRTILPLWETRK